MNKEILETTQDKITKEFCRFKIPITVTTSIYNEQLNELFDYLWNMSNKERKNTVIFCIKDIYNYVKQIGDFFKVNTKVTEYLYGNTIICVKKDFLNIKNDKKLQVKGNFYKKVYFEEMEEK